jgi:hypothetical protein
MRFAMTPCTNMTERPILFNQSMVRALLAGTKTQTRRMVKLPHMNPLGVWEPGTMGGPSMRTRKGETVPEHPVLGHSRTGDCIGPAWWRGDRLWVRETFQYADWTDDGYPFIAYQADGEKRLVECGISDEWSERLQDIWAKLSSDENYQIDSRAADRKWRPSIHMPRWASRILLEVTDVRVQRLQDISEKDAIAEGIQVDEIGHAIRPHDDIAWGSARSAFAELWESINVPGSWNSNPWVWCVSFKRINP